MKTTILKSLVILLITCTTAFAGTSSGEVGDLLMRAFVGFFVAILMIQIIPAAIVFVSMIKGVFTSNPDVQTKGE